MPSTLRSRLATVPSLPFILFILFMFVMFIAGGSSRADVAGQVVVRIAATLAIVGAILFGPRTSFAQAKPVWIILSCCALLLILQLIPLPPAIWQALPGRTFFSHAVEISGESQPWRPLSLVPGATTNALFSLLIPFATLLLVTQLKDNESRHLAAIILLIATASMLVGLMQFAGLHIASPFGDHGPMEVNGFFDNRNHFALLLAIGCAVAPAWAVSRRRQQQWRAPTSIGLTLLFALCILASGSRAGIVVGILGLLFGIMIARQGFKRAFAGYSQRIRRAIIAAILVISATALLLSVFANRAASINRILTTDSVQDMRGQAFPTVVEMVGTYFPAGTGFGSFDPIFRIYEPFKTLSPNYFNHAHNDFLEVILDGGIAGLVLLVAAFLWWCVATFRQWRASTASSNVMPQTGSAILLLVMAASAVDYPSRTPLMMVIVTIAGVWLSMTAVAREPGFTAD